MTLLSVRAFETAFQVPFVCSHKRRVPSQPPEIKNSRLAKVVNASADCHASGVSSSWMGPAIAPSSDLCDWSSRSSKILILLRSSMASLLHSIDRLKDLDLSLDVSTSS